MADVFPPSEPELAELSTCGDEADTDPEEEMEDEEDFTVQLGTTYSCRKADGTYHDAEVVKKRMNKRAKREEYMVRYVGATRRQTEWVDKSRLLLKPQEDEDAEEGSDQEIPENDQTIEYQKSDEDEPEAKRAKIEDNTGTANSSMMSSGDFTEELTCLLCDKLYEDPVMVECGHNFCRGCLDKAWVDEESFSCPDCKEVLTEKIFTTNRVFADLMKKTAGTLVKPVQKQKVLLVKNCPDHEEKLKLYCKDNGDLCCIICQDSLKHVKHTFLPILDAEEVCRAQLSGLISPLEKALNKTEDLAVQYREKIGQYKPTVMERRHHIVSEFEKLYNFLKERKETMLEQFKKESQSLLHDMQTNASKMEETRDYLKGALAEADERMNDSNSVSFLSGITPFLERVQEQRKAIQSSKDAITEQEMCRGKFKGPIQYFFWKQMKSIIGPIPECDEKPVSSRNKDSKDKTENPSAPVHSGKDGNQRSEPEESDEEAAQVPEDSEECLWIKNADLDIFPAWMYRGRREIWIVGDGYVTTACRELEKGPYGYNLGFPHPNCNVRWLSNVKLWSALMPKLKRDFLLFRRPSLIFIHLGNCDLRRNISDSLNNFVANYLTELSWEIKKVDIVLSALLPRKEWLGTPQEDFRKAFNTNLCQLAVKRRFQFAQHEELEKKLLNRFKIGDGDNFLTTEECNMFVKGMRDGLLRGMINHFKKISEKFSLPKGTSAKSSSAKGSSESVRNPPRKQSTLDLEKPLKGPINPQEITVWLVGNSYISRAQRFAEAQTYGLNLGFKERFCKIHWLGKITRWNGVVPELKKAFGGLGKPSYIFLHLGTDDLEATCYDVLVNEVRSTLGRLIQLFPKVTFILSTVLPTVEWMGCPLEECRMMINTRLGNYAERHGIQLISFDNLSMKLLDRFRGKDRHSFLSPNENEMFIMTIKDFLLIAMLKNSQAAVKK